MKKRNEKRTTINKGERRRTTLLAGYDDSADAASWLGTMLAPASSGRRCVRARLGEVT